MKIAVINLVSSLGGWKYIYMLLKHLKLNSPESEIVLFWETLHTCPFDINKDFEEINISVQRFPHFARKVYYKKKFHIKLLDDMYHQYRVKREEHKTLFYNGFRNTEEKLNSFDVVLYAWPYCEPEIHDLKVPTFFIPHDFIFTHFFGNHCGNTYNRNLWGNTLRKLGAFIEKEANAIVSTQFIANELKRTFPEYKKDINVIMPSTLNNFEELDENKCAEILERFDIKHDYLLFSTNDMHHKNMGQTLGAYFYIKQHYPNIKMIITGHATEGTRVVCKSPFYCDHVSEDESYDIKSLGMVSNEELTAIIQKAKVVINSSLCEAGCGSGLDAWSLGIPTAISNIPPYIEQVEKLGVKTEFFNPRNSEDIAKSVIKLLDNPQLAKENARISKEALNNYSWDDVAKQYIEAFKKVLANSAGCCL